MMGIFKTKPFARLPVVKESTMARFAKLHTEPITGLLTPTSEAVL